MLPEECSIFAKEGIGNAVIIIFALEIVRISGWSATISAGWRLCLQMFVGCSRQGVEGAPQIQQAGGCACKCLLVAQDKGCRDFVNRARSASCICFWLHSTTVSMLVVSRLGDKIIGETFPPPKGGGPSVGLPPKSSIWRRISPLCRRFFSSGQFRCGAPMGVFYCCLLEQASRCHPTPGLHPVRGCALPEEDRRMVSWKSLFLLAQG